MCVNRKVSKKHITGSITTQTSETEQKSEMKYFGYCVQWEKKMKALWVCK